MPVDGPAPQGRVITFDLSHIRVTRAPKVLLPGPGRCAHARPRTGRRRPCPLFRAAPRTPRVWGAALFPIASTEETA